MTRTEHKRLNSPDETRTFEKGKVELVKTESGTIGRLTLQPGWRWSEHVKPIAKTKSCEAPHFQYHVSGRLRIRMDDGTEFEAANAHVVGVSADPLAKLEDLTKKNTIKHQILSDFGRKMLPAYGVMVTDQKSPMYRLAKRAYFILDRQGIVRFVRVQANPLDLLKTEEVLKALKGMGT